MKNIFKSIMCIAAAAMAFTACSTADINEEITTPQTITVKFNALAENMTRTTFGVYDEENKEYPTLWEGDETIKLALGLTAGSNSSPVVASADKTSASFEAEFETTEEAPYTLYAICPSSAWVSGIQANNKSWGIVIPTTQEPTTTSCDPKAQILYGKAENLASLTEDVNISFKHLVAYAKFSFSKLNLDGATIQNITIEGDQNIASRYYFNVETNTISENSASNLITINTNTYENIWVALAPVEGLSTLTFTINTDKGPLTKTVNLPADKAFEAGKVAGFTVNMSGVEFEESVKYELLTDVGNLAIGDYVIIAAAEANYAISTTQNGNNRAATSVTKDENYIVDPSSSVAIFEVEVGNAANTYAFRAIGKTNPGYIYGGYDSNNRLKTEATLSDHSTWNVSIVDGVATMETNGSYDNRYLGYNPPLFACYKKNSGSRGDVAIYYKSNGGVVPPKTPVINANDPEAVAAEDTTIEIPYSVSNPVDDKELSVTESVDWVTDVAVDNEKVTLTIDANESTEARSTTITLSYEGAADKVVTISQESVYVAPEPGTGTTYYLTNAEILTAVNTGNGYADVSISSKSGTWSGNVYCATNVKYLQLRNKQNAQLTSPEFGSNIKSISFAINSGSTANRTLYIVSPDATFPSGTTAYSTTNILKTNYGSVAATVGETVTIEPTSDIKQFMLVVQGGAIYIDDITVVCE